VSTRGDISIQASFNTGASSATVDYIIQVASINGAARASIVSIWIVGVTTMIVRHLTAW
jgi:hypothetical protein